MRDRYGLLPTAGGGRFRTCAAGTRGLPTSHHQPSEEGDLPHAHAHAHASRQPADTCTHNQSHAKRKRQHVHVEVTNQPLVSSLAR
eukprot:3389872-Pyramimonas_sp.AAC.1